MATIIQIDQINSDEFSAIDLRDEAQGALGDGHNVECYRVAVEGQAQAVEVLLVPSALVAGVAWGSDAQWLDHRYSGRDGAEQVVLDFFEGQA